MFKAPVDFVYHFDWESALLGPCRFVFLLLTALTATSQTGFMSGSDSFCKDYAKYMMDLDCIAGLQFRRLQTQGGWLGD